MEKSTIIAEGRTTNEAIEKGLKILKTSKNNVEIKVLENEDKRSFFSILDPRVVKVQMTMKENKKDEKFSNNEFVKKEKVIINLSEAEQQRAVENLNNFLNKLKNNLPQDTEIDINSSSEFIRVNINNKNLGYLIGYRGETLYAIQNIMSVVANKGIEQRVRVILDIEGYKSKRETTLKELAERKAKEVIKRKNSITLEPMQAYERKIIHSYLQTNNRIETYSVGEEPYRKLIISYKK